MSTVKIILIVVGIVIVIVLLFLGARYIKQTFFPDKANNELFIKIDSLTTANANLKTDNAVLKEQIRGLNMRDSLNNLRLQELYLSQNQNRIIYIQKDKQIEKNNLTANANLLHTRISILPN